MQIIEPYTNAGGATVTVEGRTLPGLCLVEDEEGIRWLLSAYHDEVHAPTWARAAAAGAAGIIVPGTPLLDAMGLPQRHRAVSAERFAEQRHERTPNYVIPAGAWSYYESIPTYREVMEGRPGLLVVPKSSGFVHLHAHSEYSPLDGLSTVPEMVEQVVLAGQGALALTDHGRCAGHPQLQKVCLANGIEPIFGIEAYFVDDRVERPEPGDKEALQRLKNGYFHLVLWATDTEGLHNLWAMSTESFRDGMYYKPRMDWDTLRKYAKGVVASSACLRGPLSVPILNDDEDGARRNLGRLLEIFGDRFYLELQPNRLPEQEKVNRALVGIAKDYGVPLLATVDSHYPKRTDHDAHEAWIALQTNSDVGDEGDLFAVNLDLYMQDEQTVREGLAYLGQDVVDESVSNTMAVAGMCTARIEGTPTAPVYSKKGGADRDADRLLELCVANWGKVAAQPDQEFYMARFEREFALLRRKGFCGYFLMVSDYCKYAKDNGVLVGPGRGSGSGSLVAYLCDITEVDPVAAKISFERFMTEGRTSLPDFDCVAGSTEFHRDGPGDRTVEGLYIALHGRPDARPGECQACGEAMESAKRGYKGNAPIWLCVPCYKKRHHLRSKGLPSILGRNTLGRLSNQPLVDILYKGVRDTLRITVSDGRSIESTPEHRHLTLSGWREARDIRPGDLLVLMDDRGRRASHTDNLSADAKARLVERARTACEKCFEKAPEGESWLGKFEVAHLDYSTKNIDNMLFLCVKCHRGMDAQLGTPVVFRPVARVEDAGEQPVYDMVMGHEDHSWVANGFVTHNCDFPASKKEFMLQYLRDKYGDQYVISIGTQTRLHAKGIVKDLGRALRSVLLDGMDPEHAAQYSTEIDRDLALVSKIVTEAEAGTAGLGMSWEDLWAQYGDVLDPYREKYPQIFDMADRLVGRLKTYSKHAAGVVISTDRPLTSWLPLFGGGQPGEQMVSQFDMGSLEEIGEVKFDILTIRNLDTIQRAVDLIWEQRGVRVDIYHWDREYEDPQVWEGISEGRTLGIFQIETKSGTRLALRMKPQNMADLSDMNTIVRPGPMRSGLTEIYLKRRAGEEEVTYQDPRLEKITGEAQGCVIYQDHILLLLMELAGYGSDEADEVRKILGKKKVEKVAAAGQEFIQRAQEWGGMERATVEHLWEQLAEFAKYTFPKGHSYAYSMITYWTAWLKFHYPVEFFTAALSTVDKDRIPAFIKEVRRAGYTVHPPDVNLSGMGFKAEPLAVRYGLDAIDGVGGVAVEAVLEGQPYRDLDDFLERKGKKADAGIVLRLAQVGALDSMMPNRAGLVALLTGQKDGSATRCQHLADGPAQGFSEDFPAPPHATGHCTFDWSGEPAPVNPRTLKLLPHKPPPKKCTRACRQYLAPPPLDALTVEPYDDEQVRTLEHALLGVFLSSTPFDRLDPTDRANLLADAQELVTGRPRFYTVAAILMAVRRTKTRASGDAMAFVTLDTETDTVEAVVFPRKWEEIQTGMHPGQLCLVVLEKQADERGFILSEYMPVP